MTEISILLTKPVFGWVTSPGRRTVQCGSSCSQLLFSLRHSKSPKSELLARPKKQDSPLLPVSAKQKPDALVQRGPAGLVSEKSQEIWVEGGHLGPCLKGPKKEEM